MVRSRPSRLLLALLVCAVVCTPALGEPAEASDEEGASDEGDDAVTQTWQERIAVTAGLEEATSAPVGASSTLIHPGEQTGTPSALTDAVVETPAVSENGQGGLFQVFSIRGLSRQRVLTLVSGMRINSERRAGTSASFIDPLLMGSVEVLRGPATTLHGSGAMGGVVQVFPRNFDDWALLAGYDSQGDQNYQVFGTGGESWSLGVARRDKSDGEAADGTLLNDHFTQYSATLSGNWQSGPRRYELLLVPTKAEDIGKANTDFPDRTTHYPEERHGLLRFSVDSDNGWQTNAYVHGQDLETEVVETGVSRARVLNESLDYGVRWQQDMDVTDETALAWGVQADGRSGVDVVETFESIAPPAPPETFNTLDNGMELELGGFATVHWQRPSTDYELGVRVSHIDQANAGSPDVEHGGVSGFLGIVRQFGQNMRLRGSLSSGLRFPTLSEQFFSGTTGAGQTLGNPDLDPERALSAELSARWLGRKLLINGAVFYSDVDDFIERIEISPDLRTFVNLNSGTLAGLELQAMVRPTKRWAVTFGGHAIDGEADDGAALADVPPNEAFVELDHRRGRWTVGGRLTHRFEDDDPGPTEKPIPSAQLLRVSIGWDLPGAWSISVTGTNLLDEAYFRAADRKAPLAPGRSVGFQIVRSR